MPPRSKIPRTMQRLSPYRSPRKRKAFIFSYQSFDAKCSRGIKEIGGMAVSQKKRSLMALDLAAGWSHCGRYWLKFIKLRIIRSLPPFCAEYLTPETVFPEGTMLGTVFRKMSRSLSDSYSTQKNRLQVFNKGMYRVLEGYILKMGTMDYPQKRLLVRNYLRLVDVFGIFRDDNNEGRFTRVFRALLETLRRDFPDDSSFTVGMLQTMCADDDFKLSVFLDVEDRGTLEHVLRSAMDVGFDFWGLWRGVGRLSDRFNPVAVLFGYGRNELARTLLSYGFQYSNVGTVYVDRCHSLSIHRYRNIPIISPDSMELLKEKRPRDRMLLILDIFLTFGELDNSPCNIPDRVSTLVQISRSLPDPYVTPMELYNSIEGVMNMTTQKLIRICKKYASAEVYDDDNRVPIPRRLAHLSRCVVRDALAAQLRLPHGIDDLGLEKPLRVYLSLIYGYGRGGNRKLRRCCCCHAQDVDSLSSFWYLPASSVPPFDDPFWEWDSRRNTWFTLHM